MFTFTKKRKNGGKPLNDKNIIKIKFFNLENLFMYVNKYVNDLSTNSALIYLKIITCNKTIVTKYVIR